jgi:hypothetical protein
MSDTGRQREVDQNLEFFLREMPSLPASVRGKFALLRHQSITGYYDTVVDALSVGNLTYPDKMFSIQQVTNAAVDLGYYSHAVSLGATQ